MFKFFNGGQQGGDSEKNLAPKADESDAESHASSTPKPLFPWMKNEPSGVPGQISSSDSISNFSATSVSSISGDEGPNKGGMNFEDEEWKRKASAILGGGYAAARRSMRQGMQFVEKEKMKRRQSAVMRQSAIIRAGNNTTSSSEASVSSSSGSGQIVNREKKVIVLMNPNPRDRFQKLQQSRTLEMMDENGIQVDVFHKEMKQAEDLMNISNIKDDFPQIFLEDSDGKSMYFGNYEMVLGMHEVGMLGLALGAKPVFETVMVEEEEEEEEGYVSTFQNPMGEYESSEEEEEKEEEDDEVKEDVEESQDGDQTELAYQVPEDDTNLGGVGGFRSAFTATGSSDDHMSSSNLPLSPLHHSSRSFKRTFSNGSQPPSPGIPPPPEEPDYTSPFRFQRKIVPRSPSPEISSPGTFKFSSKHKRGSFLSSQKFSPEDFSKLSAHRRISNISVSSTPLETGGKEEKNEDKAVEVVIEENGSDDDDNVSIGVEEQLRNQENYSSHDESAGNSDGESARNSESGYGSFGEEEEKALGVVSSSASRMFEEDQDESFHSEEDYEADDAKSAPYHDGIEVSDYGTNERDRPDRPHNESRASSPTDHSDEDEAADTRDATYNRDSFNERAFSPGENLYHEDFQDNNDFQADVTEFDDIQGEDFETELEQIRRRYSDDLQDLVEPSLVDRFPDNEEEDERSIISGSSSSGRSRQNSIKSNGGSRQSSNSSRSGSNYGRNEGMSRHDHENESMLDIANPNVASFIENEPKDITEIGRTKILVVVVNEGKRYQLRKQERSKSFLEEFGLNFEIIDENSGRRKELVDITTTLGLSRQYPQFFLQDASGNVNFFGTYESLEELPDAFAAQADLDDMLSDANLEPEKEEDQMKEDEVRERDNSDSHRGLQIPWGKSSEEKTTKRADTGTDDDEENEEGWQDTDDSEDEYLPNDDASEENKSFSPLEQFDNQQSSDTPANNDEIEELEQNRLGDFSYVQQTESFTEAKLEEEKLEVEERYGDLGLGLSASTSENQARSPISKASFVVFEDDGSGSLPSTKSRDIAQILQVTNKKEEGLQGLRNKDEGVALMSAQAIIDRASRTSIVGDLEDLRKNGIPEDPDQHHSYASENESVKSLSSKVSKQSLSSKRSKQSTNSNKSKGSSARSEKSGKSFGEKSAVSKVSERSKSSQNSKISKIGAHEKEDQISLRNDDLLMRSPGRESAYKSKVDVPVSPSTSSSSSSSSNSTSSSNSSSSAASKRSGEGEANLAIPALGNATRKNSSDLKMANESVQSFSSKRSRNTERSANSKNSASSSSERRGMVKSNESMKSGESSSRDVDNISSRGMDENAHSLSSKQSRSANRSTKSRSSASGKSEKSITSSNSRFSRRSKHSKGDPGEESALHRQSNPIKEDFDVLEIVGLDLSGKNNAKEGDHYLAPPHSNKSYLDGTADSSRSGSVSPLTLRSDKSDSSLTSESRQGNTQFDDLDDLLAENDSGSSEDLENNLLSSIPQVQGYSASSTNLESGMGKKGLHDQSNLGSSIPSNFDLNATDSGSNKSIPQGLIPSLSSNSLTNRSARSAKSQTEKSVSSKRSKLSVNSNKSRGSSIQSKRSGASGRSIGKKSSTSKASKGSKSSQSTKLSKTSNRDEEGKLPFTKVNQQKRHSNPALGDHLVSMNQPVHSRESDDDSLGSEELFDEPKGPLPTKRLLAAAQKAREQAEVEQASNRSNPTLGDHLVSMNQPVHSRESDDDSLGSEELFDEPKGPLPTKRLLAAAQKAREQAEADKEMTEDEVRFTESPKQGSVQKSKMSMSPSSASRSSSSSSRSTSSTSSEQSKHQFGEETTIPQNNKNVEGSNFLVPPLVNNEGDESVQSKIRKPFENSNQNSLAQVSEGGENNSKLSFTITKGQDPSGSVEDPADFLKSLGLQDSDEESMAADQKLSSGLEDPADFFASLGIINYDDDSISSGDAKDSTTESKKEKREEIASEGLKSNAGAFEFKMAADQRVSSSLEDPADFFASLGIIHYDDDSVSSGDAKDSTAESKKEKREEIASEGLKSNAGAFEFKMAADQRVSSSLEDPAEFLASLGVINYDDDSVSSGDAKDSNRDAKETSIQESDSDSSSSNSTSSSDTDSTSSHTTEAEVDQNDSITSDSVYPKGLDDEEINDDRRKSKHEIEEATGSNFSDDELNSPAKDLSDDVFKSPRLMDPDVESTSKHKAEAEDIDDDIFKSPRLIDPDVESTSKHKAEAEDLSNDVVKSPRLMDPDDESTSNLEAEAKDLSDEVPKSETEEKDLDLELPVASTLEDSDDESTSSQEMTAKMEAIEHEVNEAKHRVSMISQEPEEISDDFLDDMGISEMIQDLESQLERDAPTTEEKTFEEEEDDDDDADEEVDTTALAKELKAAELTAEHKPIPHDDRRNVDPDGAKEDTAKPDARQTKGKARDEKQQSEETSNTRTKAKPTQGIKKNLKQRPSSGVVRPRKSLKEAMQKAASQQNLGDSKPKRVGEKPQRKPLPKDTGASKRELKSNGSGPATKKPPPTKNRSGSSAARTTDAKKRVPIDKQASDSNQNRVSRKTSSSQRASRIKDAPSGEKPPSRTTSLSSKKSDSKRRERGDAEPRRKLREGSDPRKKVGEGTPAKKEVDPKEDRKPLKGDQPMAEKTTERSASRRMKSSSRRLERTRDEEPPLRAVGGDEKKKPQRKTSVRAEERGRPKERRVSAFGPPEEEDENSFRESEPVRTEARGRPREKRVSAFGPSEDEDEDAFGTSERSPKNDQDAPARRGANRSQSRSTKGSASRRTAPVRDGEATDSVSARSKERRPRTKSGSPIPSARSSTAVRTKSRSPARASDRSERRKTSRSPVRNGSEEASSSSSTVRRKAASSTRSDRSGRSTRPSRVGIPRASKRVSIDPQGGAGSVHGSVLSSSSSRKPQDADAVHMSSASKSGRSRHLDSVPEDDSVARKRAEEEERKLRRRESLRKSREMFTSQPARLSFGFVGDDAAPPENGGFWRSRAETTAEKVQLLQDELSRLKGMANEVAVFLKEEAEREEANGTPNTNAALEHERRKARALTKKIKELDPDYPVDDKGSLVVHDPRNKSLVFPGDVSELSNVSRSKKPKPITHGTRGVGGPPLAGGGGDKGSFLYNWVPDKWANYTAYKYGIGDRPRKKRTAK